MADPVAKGFIEILADKVGFGKSVDELGTHPSTTTVGQKIGSQIGSGFSSAFKVAAVGGIAAVTAGIAAGAGLYKIGESFDAEFDKIRVGTGKTGDALKGLQNDLKATFASTPASLADAGTAIAAINTKLGLAGKPLEDLSVQFLNLSRITKTDVAANIDVASKAFNNFGVNAKDQGGSLDYLFKVTQATGIGFDKLSGDLASNGVVLRQAGLGFDASAALLGSLSKAGLDAGDVMPGLSKALAAAAKEGKPAQQVISDTFKAIKNAPSDTAAAGDALAVFGAKGGPKLAAAIREGKLSYDDLMKTLESSPETINKASADTADFAEKWQLVKNRVLVGLQPLAAKVFDGIGIAMDKLGPYVTRFSDWFNKELPIAVAYVQPKLESLFGWLRDNVPPVLSTMGDIITTKLVPALQTLGAGFLTAFGFVMDHKEILVGLGVVVGTVLVFAFLAWAAATWAVVVAQIALWGPIVAVGVVLGALVAGVIYAYEHWGWFKTAVDGVIDALGWLWNKVLQPVAEWLGGHWSEVLTTAARVMAAVFTVGLSEVGKLIYDHWDDIIKFIEGLPGKIAAAASGMWDGLTGGAKDAANLVIDAVNAIIRTVNSFQFHESGVHQSTPFGEITIVPAFDWNGFNISQLPHFDKGGLVPGAVGAPQLAVVHGGEFVTRADGSNAPGGGMVNHFYGIDKPRDVLTELSWAMATRGGRV